MALTDLTERQAKAAEKTYSIPDTDDGLGLVVAPPAANRGICATTGSASKSESPWATTPRSYCAKHAPCVMKPGRSWRRASSSYLSLIHI